jgi:hypothetical protein
MMISCLELNLNFRHPPEVRFLYCYFALVAWPDLVDVRFHPDIHEHPLV